MLKKPTRRRESEAGFTLTEVLIASFVLVLVLAGVLALLELNTDLARAQTQLADLQQSIRVAQSEMISDVRMAGRGGLPRGDLPDGVAVAVRNDVPQTGAERFIAVGDNNSPAVVAGSDVLSVRGVFSTPVYQLDTLAGNLTLNDDVTPTEGTIRVQNPIPNVGVPQNLQPLIDATTGEALLLVSPLGGFAVVMIDSGVAGHNTSNANDIRLGFKIGTLGGTNREDLYAELSNGFPAELRSVAHLGLLEEYRYFVRERFAVAGDSTSDLTPSLTRARLFPGTEVAHTSDPNLGEDVADNVFDLQVALGVDTNNDEVIAEDGSGTDDWLFNASADVDGSGDVQSPTLWNGASQPPLYYVRLTTLARTDRRDRNYQAPLLTTVEDKDYGVTPFNRFNTREERMFRRRLLRTVVDLRNLS